MTDRLGRPIRDLRISVTDRCNFRCRYCMPQEVFGPGYAFLPRAELLSYEEIERVATVAAGLGVTKLRLTGGEPLLRRDLDQLVSRLSAIDGIEDLALTTNGSLLTARAAGLAAAGLSRVTVSLDALDDTTFAAMNGVGVSVDRVLEGIAAAAAGGLGPVKVNAVVQAGVNEHAILELAAFCREAGHTLRFIEYMDVGTTNQWRTSEVVSAAEIRSRVHARWPVEPLAPNYPGEVAQRYRYVDGAGEVGFIASVTEPFCGGCTRARLSADGQLYTCLFSGHGHDLRALVRSGASDQDLRQRLARIWGARDDRYSEVRSQATSADGEPKVEMSFIGG